MTKIRDRTETRDCRIALFVAPSTLRYINGTAKRLELSRAEYIRRLLNWGWLAVNAGEDVLALIMERSRDRDGGSAGDGEAGSTAKQRQPDGEAGSPNPRHDGDTNDG